MTEKCDHTNDQRDQAAVTGPCSLCMEADIARLRAVVDWVDSWVSNPVGSYSVSALDGLFGMTRDRIVALRADRTTEDNADPDEGLPTAEEVRGILRADRTTEGGA